MTNTRDPFLSDIFVRRERNGQLAWLPFSVEWRPSANWPGGRLVIRMESAYPSAYSMIEVTVQDGRLWVLRRTDTEDCHYVRQKSLRWSCDCHGFTSKKYCRHVDAMRIIDDEGLFEIKKGLYVDVNHREVSLGERS